MTKWADHNALNDGVAFSFIRRADCKLPLRQALCRKRHFFFFFFQAPPESQARQSGTAEPSGRAQKIKRTLKAPAAPPATHIIVHFVFSGPLVSIQPDKITWDIYYAFFGACTTSSEFISL